MASTSPPPTARAEPFVLFDDARQGRSGGTRVYRKPVDLIIARRLEEVSPALDRLRAFSRDGWWLAGYIAYEAGLALEPRLAHLGLERTGATGPLMWFGVFPKPEFIAQDGVPEWLMAHANCGCTSQIGPLETQLSPGGYAQAFEALRQAINAGDIYQANFTFPLSGPWRGDPLAIYAALRGRGGGAHGGVLFDGSDWLISFSPELFFTLHGEAATVRPMKGTRPRGRNAFEDAGLAADLAASPKDRAENLMILDLMRNDLSRISEPGSVRVEAPFSIEAYPTVHQMVSTVHARLLPGCDAVDMLRALFPCGSVTGAPKMRSMELIAVHERDPRGPYCGAFGRIDPCGGNGTGEAAFNVAIRTLRLTPGEGGAGTAVMGVGSAIVADSESLPEWRECLLKGGFVHQPQPEGAAGRAVAQFDLIETMRFTPDQGVPLLELHLERLRASAIELGFTFDRHAARNAIQALCFEADAPSKLRLVLSRSGATSLEIAPLPAPVLEPVACAVLPVPLDVGDWRLSHKTSDRMLYDAGLRAGLGAGAFETLLIRDDGLLTEGCFTNIFVEDDGVLKTPPAALGLLPGVLRQHLLDEGRAIEAALRLADLENGFFIGNALRGLMAARLIG